ncbi:MAG: response regulator transcription factor [Isosphaeraceae bacterium]
MGGEAADAEAACAEVERLRPDVAVLDVSMPGMGGIPTARRLRDRCPDVKILALTIHEDESFLRGLLEAGAVGFVLKRSAVEELIPAIRTVAAGGLYHDARLAGPPVTECVDDHTPEPPSPLGELTEHEAQVVRLIAMGHGIEEIAIRLGISIRTVEAHKARSLEKLEMHSRADLVRYSLQRGWLRDP